MDETKLWDDKVHDFQAQALLHLKPELPEPRLQVDQYLKFGCLLWMQLVLKCKAKSIK